MSRVSPGIKAPRGRSPRTTHLQTAVELSVLTAPRFAFAPKSNHEIILAGAPSLSGDAPFLVPFRIANADYTKSWPVIYEVLNNWTLDIDVTTIDLTTFIGGIVDGLGLTADTDYLIWAFTDEYLNFKGFGMTSRPLVIDGVNTFGGGLGVAGSKFTVTTNHGWRYSVGARVLIRVGTALGDSYNQGVITEVFASSLTVDLDAAYTDIDLEGNTNLIGLSGLQIIQIDNFAPRLYNQDSLYPGSAVEHQYSYIGSLQVWLDPLVANIVLRRPRKRGEALAFHVRRHNVFHQVNPGATVISRVCLARWLPLGTRAVTGILTIFGTNVNSFINVQTDSVSGEWGITGARTSGGGVSSTSYIGLTRFHNTSLLYELNIALGSNMTGDGYISGYNEDRY